MVVRWKRGTKKRNPVVVWWKRIRKRGTKRKKRRRTRRIRRVMVVVRWKRGAKKRNVVVRRTTWRIMGVWIHCGEEGGLGRVRGKFDKCVRGTFLNKVFVGGLKRDAVKTKM